MNKKGTLFQVVSSVGTKIIVLFGSFIVSVILARVLGAEGKGIVTAIFVVPNLLISLADLGIRQATTFYVGKKIYTVERVLPSLLFVWGSSSLLSILVAVLYFSTGSSMQYGWPILIIPIITIPLMLMNKYLDGIFLGIQKVYYVNLKQILSFLVNFIAVLILVVVLNLGVYGAASVTLIAAFSTLIFSLYILKKNNSLKFKYSRGTTGVLIKKGFIYAVALFVLSLNYKIDIVFLERLATSSDVGIYSIGVSLSELIWQIPAAMGMVLFSKSANSSSENIAVNRSTRLLRISWIPIIVISCILWASAPYIIPFVYGEEFVGSVTVIRLLLPGIIAMVLFKLLNADLAGRGYPLFALRVYFLALLINIVLNLVLIPKWGINGAAIASTFSYTIGAILFSYSYYKQTKINVKDLFIVNKSDMGLIKNTIKKLMEKAGVKK